MTCTKCGDRIDHRNLILTKTGLKSKLCKKCHTQRKVCVKCGCEITPEVGMLTDCGTFRNVCRACYRKSQSDRYFANKSAEKEETFKSKCWRLMGS